ncbi:hypothetical protein BGZ88_003487 [Linnemannia elongata]|nr:hypothetical protein BGZ88_003487 [Linnemannia elongata]
MLQEDLQPHELVQAIRSVEKHLAPSSILPPRPDEIFYVECHPDPETQKPVVLWDDILQAFDGAVQVRHKAKIVPFLKGKDLRILEPHRIAMAVDTVLDVVVCSKGSSSPTSVSEGTVLGLLPEGENTDRKVVVSQDSYTSNTTSPIRRSPVYGLVETALENYNHIDRPHAFPSARRLQAVLDDQTCTVKDHLTTPPLDHDNRYQLRRPQIATTDVPVEMDVVQTSICAMLGDKIAQVTLGDMYRDGKGVPQDYQAAMNWYFMAVEQGDAAGQHRVGALHDKGFGVPQNHLIAMAWYIKAAEQGHASSQNSIGLLYHYGRGVLQDYAQAMEWYLMAAEQGHTDSQYNVGVSYKHGQGVPLDYKQAMDWFLKAAQQGDASSQFSIGLLYDNGQGVPQDYALAMEWYLKAANQGYAFAQNSIGVLYYHGRGVPQDFAQAMDWYVKSAEQENDAAQYNIGLLYINGQGVPQDFAKAAEWFFKAADRKHNGAKRELEALKKKGVALN